jgi:hypothetical protein
MRLPSNPNAEGKSIITAQSAQQPLMSSLRMDADSCVFRPTSDTVLMNSDRASLSKGLD